MLKCVNDEFDRFGSTYESMDDFLRMCETVFHEVPRLTFLGDRWVDTDTGELVLEVVDNV